MTFEMRYNGILLPIRVKSVGGRGLVNVEATTVTIPNADGSYYVKKRLPDKPMPVECSIFSNGLTDIRKQVDAINNILIVGETVPVTFSDELDITYYAYLNGEADWEEKIYKADGTIPLMRKPYKYGKEVTFQTTAPDRFIINNTGVDNTNFVITVTFSGTASDYKVTDARTGNFIRVIYGFVATDVLEIDFAKRKILINGKIQMTTLDFASNWFKLAKGTNQLNLVGTSPSTSKLTIKPRFA